VANAAAVLSDEATRMKSRELTALEESLGHHFQRQELLEQAVTHSSQAREAEAANASNPESAPGRGDNELLEFLGDAVLGLVTSETLFHRFPGFHEGHLSKLRAHLVGQRHLLRVAEQLQIGNYIRLGRGEEKSGGRGKASLLVDALEAILAALYLDGGWRVARDFIVRAIVEPELAHMNLETSAIPVMDFKSALQEALQAKGGAQPAYVLVKEEGPEHRKTFTVEVRLSGPEAAQFVGRAEGATKKRAEQEAARQVLEHLAKLPEARQPGAESDDERRGL
jgi:ribonuclease III